MSLCRFRPRASCWCALSVLAVLGWGCVSADAGYGDVRQLVTARTGRDVRWQEHDSESHRDPLTRELLSKPLSVEAAVQVALLNDARIQAAFEDLGVARAELVRRLRIPNPSVDAALRFEPGGSQRPEIDLSALISLTELALLPLANGAGQARLEAAKLSVTGQILDLALETRVAFYRQQAAQQTLELDHSIVAALRASLEAAEALHAAGNITNLRLESERVLYEDARLALARAEAALYGQRQELAALLGIWQAGSDCTTEPRLAVPSSASPLPADFEARAIDQSLDLQLARARYAAAAKEANLATARGWIPDLRAGVSAERKDGVEPGWGVGPAVSLEVPLFYQGQGERGAALADLRRQEQLHTALAVRIRSSARALSTRVEAASKSVDYYQQVLLPLRQKILDETQLEYNAMSIGVFQLLEAKRAQIDAARTYVALLEEYWVARAEAEQLLAGRLPSQGARSAAPDVALGETGAAAH